jgi:tetratricopeptide (TPR) repeat protein
MSFRESLGPRFIGAEVLVQIAHKRLTGTLTWNDSTTSVEIIFVVGRPQVLIDASGAQRSERESMEHALERLALALSGFCLFEDLELSDVAHHESLRLDTPGMILKTVLHDLSSADIDAIWEARLRYEVRATPLFERVSAAVGKFNGTRLERPSLTQTVGQLLAGTSSDVRRSWIALLVLGAFDVVSIPEPDYVAEEELPLPSTSAELSEEEISRRRVLADIKDAYRQFQGANHYELLGVSQESPVEAVDRAFAQKEKLWNSDQYATSDLGDARALLDELYLGVQAAHDVLGDQDKRADYDSMLERKAKGFAVDPKVIFQAEEFFRRGQVLVRRGNDEAAEPLLRKAIDLNKGDFEFWAYLGFAIYGARGPEAVEEALQALSHAEEGDGELDCVYEFQGRIARSEGNFIIAKEKLSKALVMNPENWEAERELQVVNTRLEDEVPPQWNLPNALKGLLGKRS